MMTQPRPQHYSFAHRVLPGWFYNEPERFIETIDEDGMLFVHFLWERAGEGLDEVVEPVGLAFERVKRDGTSAVVITCPEPIGMTEAYFVALVIPKGKSERVFTLEYSFDLEENPLSISCEWTKDHTHINKGAFDGTDREAFIDYVFTSLIAN